jgi:hypothetical protein
MVCDLKQPLCKSIYLTLNTILYTEDKPIVAGNMMMRKENRELSGILLPGPFALAG